MTKQELFNSVINGFADLRLKKMGLRRDCAEIMNNAKYSDQYKKTLIDNLQEDLKEYLEETRERLKGAAEDLQVMMDETTPQLDFTDNQLQSVLLIAQTPSAAGIPATAQKAIVTPFLHNETILKIIEPLLKGTGMTSAHIAVVNGLEDFKRARAFTSGLNTVLYAATQSPDGDMGALESIRGDADAYARVNEIDFPELSEEYHIASVRDAMGLI